MSTAFIKTMAIALRRKRLCTGCGDYFRPGDDDPDFIRWCCEACQKLIYRASLQKSRDSRAKAAKKDNNKKRRDVQPISHWLKLTQGVFNEFIRLRDAGDGCISCGTTSNIQYCAGHFRTRGAAGHLRYDELNVHKQCNKRCNLELSGNIAGYRPGLIKKIGLKAVISLENNNTLKSWEREELELIRKKYRKQLKELEHEKGGC